LELHTTQKVKNGRKNGMGIKSGQQKEAKKFMKQ